MALSRTRIGLQWPRTASYVKYKITVLDKEKGTGAFSNDITVFDQQCSY